MLCEDLALHLSTAGGSIEPADLPLPLRHHLARCLHCQAERAAYTKLVRNLGSLRTQRVEPDELLLGEILDSVRPPATVTPIRSSRRKAYVGGIAAAATAGAAGALVLVTKLTGHRLAG